MLNQLKTTAILHFIWIFMVFMAFFIVIKRDTFAKGYKK